MSDAAILEDEAVEVTVNRRNDAGELIDTVALDRAIFAVTPNVPLMHQVVTAQLAARRAGTHSTKTRAEVAGGGSKPYRQKGTGRARQGTIRAPHFAGGGVAMGPKPRDYTQRTPRKMVRHALLCALSDRAAEGRVCIVDEWSFEVPKTKDAVKALDALDLYGTVLVVLGADDAVAERSFANLPHVNLVEGAQLTAYDVLVSDWVVFTNATLPGDVTIVATPPPKEVEEEDVEEELAEDATEEVAASGDDESNETEAEADVEDTAEDSDEAVTDSEESDEAAAEDEEDDDEQDEEDDEEEGE